MRLLADALAGRSSEFGASIRLFSLFLLTTFVVEAMVMLVLPWLLPSNLTPTTNALLDATLLTLVLAPVVWRVFLVPIRRLHDDRGQLLERTLSAQEAERARIARDLHDGLGQNLTSMLLHLRVIEETATVDVVRQHVGTLRTIAATSLEDLRRVVRETRPPVLDDLGLAAALDKLLADIHEIGGVDVNFLCEGEGIERLPPAVETALYRVIQEAVTNAVRHAHANHLTVTFARRDDEVAVTISDDGKGFDVDGVFQGEQSPFGLLSMRERVRPLGGAVTFVSDAGQGTVVHVRVPLDGAGERS